MDKKVYNKQSAVCNCLNLRRASQAITEVYDEFLAPSELKISQFSLLKHIKHMGPVSVSALALKIRLDRTTLVRNLKPIEVRGLITDIAEKGTRNRQLKLTDKGLETFEKAERLWSEAQSFIEQYLGKDDINTLTVLLSKIEALVP
ncbi:DNA-binding MarR family transcriptional regulator [Anaerosolibacter carboniphilus]|uniref:DNA-binding MarR family transcriptional regulator n=1 Tax=Anaerosolibacter carboniphilus TaxID=1417629 RepID=A0A841KQ64_9FIRM|nr:MarR family winged helix-turn-helix transcriptional regulator [Anaerosolibacter carboniphilus]MBB6214240.1 DNA-binding MarR family transcriptional regulator [Anaerosolibacter carboniphilus]